MAIENLWFSGNCCPISSVWSIIILTFPPSSFCSSSFFIIKYSNRISQSIVSPCGCYFTLNFINTWLATDIRHFPQLSYSLVKASAFSFLRKQSWMIFMAKLKTNKTEKRPLCKSSVWKLENTFFLLRFLCDLRTYESFWIDILTSVILSGHTART